METIQSARFESPIGTLRIASTAKGLAYLGLPRAGGRGFSGWLARMMPDAKREEAFAPNRAAIREVLEYLEGKRTAFDVPLDLRGTSFQRAVWDALLAIPYGETQSYLAIARTLKNPGAVRAVGSANNANPVPLIVPCHRVIQSDGKLGGYGGGADLKRQLLAMEQSGVRRQGSLF